MSVLNTHKPKDRPKGVPDHATATFYKGENGKSGTYYVWQVQGKWQWESMGNNGGAPTEQDASERCRWWIKHAQ